MRDERTNPFARVLLMIPIGIAALLALTPFFWLTAATVKRGNDLFNYAFLPWRALSTLTLDNFRSLFRDQPFAQWMTNSLFLASAQTTCVVSLSSLGGFALAKYQFAGKRVLMLLMLLTMLLPSQVLMPSSYELMWHFGWVDSYKAILVPGAVSVFGMFLFRQAMGQVPDELLHAGRVDGCSELRLWWEVALPIVRPMVGAFTLMTFIGSWNSFLWPQVVLQDEMKYNLPIGLANMVSQPDVSQNYSVLMCGTFLSIVPVMLLFTILQKDFIAGLASGAVKG